MKIVTIIGARPQIIKAAALSRAIAKHHAGQIREVIVHTGQHYDENMSQVFFDELQIPRPDYNLHVGSASHGIQTARMTEGIEAVLLKIFGMGEFDAICHAFSTIATGGFSTRNLSIAAYASPAIHYTIAGFTLLSGINFTLIILLFRGKPQRLLKDEETHWYLAAVGIFTAILTIGLFLQDYTTVGAGFQSDTAVSVSGWIPTLRAAEHSFRYAFFEIVCTMTSCGFSLGNYMEWKPVLWCIIFFLMFTGGCAGSTAGGVKWVRYIVFAKNASAELRRRVHPYAVFSVNISGKPLERTAIQNAMAFMFFYLLFIVLAMVAFCALGVDFTEAFGAAASAIGNIGPSLGEYGPAGTYASFPLIGKWIYAGLMLVGRLELFTVLLLFSPTLWRK